MTFTLLTAFIKNADSNQKEFILLRTFNETNTAALDQSNWRQKLDVQKRSVIINEIRNNMFRVSRWTAQAILSGIKNIGIGYRFYFCFF